jgi:hypothetical protein
MKPDTIGWIATAAFACSYLCKKPVTLRRVQALGASIWIAYGLAVRSAPVVVANLVVVSMALLSTWNIKVPLLAPAELDDPKNAGRPVEES